MVVRGASGDDSIEIKSFFLFVFIIMLFDRRSGAGGESVHKAAKQRRGSEVVGAPGGQQAFVLAKWSNELGGDVEVDSIGMGRSHDCRLTVPRLELHRRWAIETYYCRPHVAIDASIDLIALNME